MRSRVVLAGAAALIAIQPIASFGDASAAAARQRFSVAGIQIGDSPTEVFADLRNKQYHITKITRSDSFAARLDDARNSELRRPATEKHATDLSSVIGIIGDQRLRIDFDDDSHGVRIVSHVYYESSSVARPFNVVRSKLITRYGDPQANDATGSAWCELDPPDICLAHGVRGDRLKIGHDHRGFDISAELTTIDLEVGTQRRRNWGDSFGAALARSLKSKDAF